MRGGGTAQPAPALPDPADRSCATISRAMEARDLDGAQAMLGDGFRDDLPRHQADDRLSELIDWSKTRYRFVKKTYDGFDAMHSEGVAVVYCARHAGTANGRTAPRSRASASSTGSRWPRGF